MISFKWQFLEPFVTDDKLTKIKYRLTGTDGQNSVETEGVHVFENETANKPFTEIVESDLIQWIEKETTKDDVNPIKLNVENQLNAMGKDQKAELPWLADTFTIE